MKINSQYPPVLLTNIHERSALCAWQSLKDFGVWVIPSTSAKGFRSLVYRKEIEKHPCPINEFSAFVDWIKSKLYSDQRLIVFPINEAIIFACDQIRLEHREMNVRFIMPSHASLKYSLSKYFATKAALDAGIKTPETFFIKAPNTKDIEPPIEALKFPLIIKWDNAVKPAGVFEKGSLRIVHTKNEMEDVIAELAPSSCGIIIQEMVPGSGVGAFFLRHQGKILLRFAHRRLHEVPWTGGISSYCESSDDEEVLDAAEQLLEAIDYEGLAMVEFRKEKGKPPVFLEINGRLWGSLGLALRAGADFPRAMVEYHYQQFTTVKQPSLKRKVRWHDPSLDMMYLRSLWTEKAQLKEVKAPKLKGVTRVAINFLNPLVASDWMKIDKPGQTAKRYLRLLKSELAQLKRWMINKLKTQKSHPLLQSTINRTQSLIHTQSYIKSILFVCYGNICRSPYAEVRWRDMRQLIPQLPIAYSAGFHKKTGRSTPLRFQSVARHLDVELSDHRSRCINHDMIANADIVVVMDVRNLMDMHREFPDAMEKTILLGALSNPKNAEVSDPFGDKIGAGGEVYRRIDNELCLLEKLLIKK